MDNCVSLVSQSESKRVSPSVVSHSFGSHALQPTRLLCPWNSPVKNTGVGCHFLLQGNLPNPGIKPGSPALQADSWPFESLGKATFSQRNDVIEIFWLVLQYKASYAFWGTEQKNEMAIKYPNGPEMSAIIHYHGTSWPQDAFSLRKRKNVSPLTCLHYFHFFALKRQIWEWGWGREREMKELWKH